LSGFFKKVYEIVAEIPPGAVMTYGQIAAMAGNSRASRAVGYALRVLPDGSELPWHRVVNSKGEISSRRTLQGDDDRILQRMLLENEGIVFSSSSKIDLKKYQLVFEGHPALQD
jgi:methylated-DNA-protein-cysteine methyltransferase-like protein